MMALPETLVLSVLLNMPVCWADRSDARKQEQLETIAKAVAIVANESKRPVDKAAKLISKAYHETRFCIAVHSGKHRGPGRGLYQLEGQGERYKGPFVGLDFESTLNATRVASDYLDRSFQCGPSPRAVFTAYAGRECGTTWKTLDSRVRTYRWVAWRLSR